MVRLFYFIFFSILGCYLNWFYICVFILKMIFVIKMFFDWLKFVVERFIRCYRGVGGGYFDMVKLFLNW